MKEQFKKITSKSIKEVNKLQYEIIQKISDLALAGFGLVAALAWNEAIKSLFDKIFPQSGGIIAKFIYAIVVTVIIVFITMRIGKILNLANKKLAEEDKDSLDKLQ